MGTAHQSQSRWRADQADKRLATLTIQTEVRFATPAEQHAFAYELADTLGQLVTKYHREDAPEGPEFSFTVTGHPTVSPPATNSSVTPAILRHAVPTLR